MDDIFNVTTWEKEISSYLEMPEFLQFEEELASWGITLSVKQKEQLILFYFMIIERNKVINLTTIIEYKDVLKKHFLDSLSIAELKKIHDISSMEYLSSPLRVIDLGTGAGFPGIPLKIVFPNLEITLVDSLNKRVTFLNDVITALDLKGINAVHSRAEDLARNPLYRERFDLCVSRAVANYSTLLEYCLPYVTLGGQFISYKSISASEELLAAKNALFLLGGKIVTTDSFILADSIEQRTLIVTDKIKKSPKSYPRKAGIPGKNPL